MHDAYSSYAVTNVITVWQLYSAKLVESSTNNSGILYMSLSIWCCG